MNINTIKLPFIIFICHLPIFLIKIHNDNKPVAKRKKIEVNTIQIINRKENSYVAATSIATPKKKVQQTHKSKNPVKKQNKKKICNRKKLQKSLNKPIDKGKKEKRITSTSKKTLQKRKIDARKQEREYNEYLQVVSEILSESLTLPEEGKVKLAIVIANSGNIVEIDSLFSESQNNLNYLKKNIKKLNFPKYKNQKQRIFKILFDNEK